MSHYSQTAGRHGHRASTPTEIPGRGWKEIALRVKDQVKYDHVQVVSAGVAFYFFFALFPAFAALISIYGLVTDPAQVEQQMGQLTSALPQQARDVIADILSQVASKSGGTLGFSLVFSIVLSLWSANKGVAALFEGINITYNEIDRRSFIKQKALTLLFTLGGILVLILCLALIVGFPAVAATFGLPSMLETAIAWLRWPLLGLVVMLSLGITYKVAPDRHDAEFRWVSWGAAIATLLWIAGSLLFSWYVNSFGSFDKTYGSFAAIIILMLWFFLTAYIILLGAEINSEMEHQTSRDTTVGEEKPMGERGAYYADRVAGDPNDD